VGGQIISFEWLDAAQNLLGVGATLNVRLPDGLNQITLRVTGSDLLTATTSVTVVVAAALLDDLLETLPSLTPNQRSLATTVDSLCARLAQLAATQPLPLAQLDLLNRCNGIIATVNPLDQVAALDQLGSSDLTALRTQALLFSSAQNSGVMQRLAATRHAGAMGGRKLNFGGSTVSIDGKQVPVEQLQMLAEKLCDFLGGCGPIDDEEGAGSLLSDRLGLWARSNYDLGEKSLSPMTDGFEGKQWGLTAGADYRLGAQSVVGLALGYGKSDIDFRPTGRGGLATRSWLLSLYGSTYPVGDMYLDAALNFGSADYDTTRHILYSEGGTPVERTAFGASKGLTIGGGISAGYDWSWRGFTFSPALGYFHTRAKIDSFNESGADGLDLSYGEQSHESSEANLSVSINYAWSTPWMVLVPHLRGEYLHEFNSDIEVFGVRFVNDPFADDLNPTPPMVVQSDVPDQWYWRMAAGLSAQFKFGISGYVEYQRLQDFQYMDFENFTVGLRFQRSLK
jgi:outer membrane autotransporter protein